MERFQAQQTTGTEEKNRKQPYRISRFTSKMAVCHIYLAAVEPTEMKDYFGKYEKLLAETN